MSIKVLIKINCPIFRSLFDGMKFLLAISLFVFCIQTSVGQLGGTNTFGSLSLPQSPRAAGMGGSSIAVFDDHIDLALENPANIDSTLHHNLSFNNSFYLAGIKYGNLAYARTFNKAGTFIGGIKYVSYGSFDGRDIAGNSTGTFKGGDYVFSVGTGRTHQYFHYGITAKFLYSHLDSYSSLGLAVDVAGSFYNPDKGITATAIIKNAGIQLKTYVEGNREKLPLEVSLGFSKKFEHLPFKLFVVIHNLQKFDIRYEDLSIVEEDNVFGTSSDSDKKYIADKIFRHFIFGGEIDFGKYITARFGYNHLRRQEMLVDTKKGLIGVSVGTTIKIKQFRIDYSFAKYHISQGTNTLGISVNLNNFGSRSVESLSSSIY